jgi:site-specific DNA recombinase
MTSARSAIYARISDDRRGEEVGVDRQLAACRELAERSGKPVAVTFTDNDISAYSGKPRPGFESLLEAMTRGDFGTLVVWHVDRLYRSMKDLERIIDAAETGGVKIETVTSGDLDLSTSAGKMIARILGSVARQESEHHAERRREANKERALAGSWRREGSRPFGFNSDGSHREPEASMLRKAATDLLSGVSLHAVAREWNAAGVTTVRGVQWTNLHVRRVLTNARVAALRVHQGKVVGPGKWEPIIEPERWHGLVALLTNPERKNALAFERKYLLSGVALCGVCDKPLYAAHPHGKDRAMLYVCRNGSHVGRKGEDLDVHIETIVMAFLMKGGLGVDLRNEENNVDLADLRTKRDGLVETKDQLATLLRKRILDVAGVEREAKILDAEIEEINRQLSDSVVVHPLVAILAEDGEDPADLDAEKLVERWLAASADRRGKAIKALLRIKVHPTGRGERVFNPSTVEIDWIDYRVKELATL